MSGQPYTPPSKPLMTPERARDLARSYKALAEQLAEAGDNAESRRMERDAQWWLTYSIALAQTNGRAP